MELHAYQPDMFALTIEEMMVEDPPCRECGKPKAEHAVEVMRDIGAAVWPRHGGWQ